MSKMMKRWLAMMALAMALVMPVARAIAEEPAAAPSHAEAAVEHGKTHGEHAEIDERLVPIPPSKDTLVSAVWVIIIFLAMLAILYPTAWKNVLAGLKKREERIRKDIADAEAARAKAEATLRDYNAQLATAEAKVRDMIAKATADGEKLAASIRAHAQQEAEESKERANKDIAAARDQAVEEIKTLAADLSTSIAEKILRRKITVEDQQSLLNSSLEQLSRVKAN